MTLLDDEEPNHILFSFFVYYLLYHRHRRRCRQHQRYGQ